MWLWCRLAAVALIQPLAWELPYAICALIKIDKILFISYISEVLLVECKVRNLEENLAMNFLKPCIPYVLECLGCCQKFP